MRRPLVTLGSCDDFVLTLSAVLLSAPVLPAAAELRTDARSLPSTLAPLAASDWLISGTRAKAGAYRGPTDQDLVLDNGLIRRSFRLQPNAATVGFDNLSTGRSIIRAVKPEANLTLNGVQWEVGGLSGQPEKAYLLPQWIDHLTSRSNAFRCVGFSLGQTTAPVSWRRSRHAVDLPWPPQGARVDFDYERPDAGGRGLTLTVHYELFDGIPVLAKWLTLRNGTDQPVSIDALTTEILATVEVDSAVDERDFRNWRLPAIDLMSDYSFHGMDATTASQVTAWLTDPEYTSQVNYELKMPAILLSRAPWGPDVQVPPGQSFESHRTYVVVYDTHERERQGLTLRHAQRVLAPWITENPIMMHVRSAQTGRFPPRHRNGPYRDRRITRCPLTRINLDSALA